MPSGKEKPYFISAHKTPLTAVLSTTGTFFGGQSIHWLLFKPLYNGYFLLSPRWPLRSGSSLLILSEVSQLHRRGGDTCDDTCNSLIRIFWLHLKHGVQRRWKQFLRTFTCPCWFPCRSLNNKKIILRKKLSFFSLPFLFLSRCDHQFFSSFFSSA